MRVDMSRSSPTQSQAMDNSHSANAGPESLWKAGGWRPGEGHPAVKFMRNQMNNVMFSTHIAMNARAFLVNDAFHSRPSEPRNVRMTTNDR